MQYRPNEAGDTSINWPETLSHRPWDSSSTASREFTTIIMKLNDKEFHIYFFLSIKSICIQSNTCKLYQRQKTETVCVCVCVLSPRVSQNEGNLYCPLAPWLPHEWEVFIHQLAVRALRPYAAGMGTGLLYPRPQPPFPRHRAVYRWPEMGSHGNPERPAYHAMAPFSLILSHE